MEVANGATLSARSGSSVAVTMMAQRHETTRISTWPHKYRESTFEVYVVDDSFNVSALAWAISGPQISELDRKQQPQRSHADKYWSVLSWFRAIVLSGYHKRDNIMMEHWMSYVTPIPAVWQK